MKISSAIGIAVKRAWVVVVLHSLLAACCIAQDNDINALRDRAEESLNRLDHTLVQQLIDSIRASAVPDRDGLLLARIWEARMLRRMGRTLDAHRAIAALMDSVAPAAPAVRLACEHELACVLLKMKLMDKAERAARREYDMALAVGRPKELVIALELIATIDRHQGRYAASLDRLNEAERVADKNGDINGLCLLRIGRANLHYEQERYAEALKGYREALDCATELGYVGQAGNAAFNIGSVTHFLKGPEDAIAFYDSLMLNSALRNEPAFEADVRNNIGTIANDAKDYRRARTELTKAMAIFRALGDTTDLVTSFQYISNTFLALGMLDSALHAAQRSADISAQAGLMSITADAEHRLSAIHERMGNHQQAMDHLRNSHELRIALVQDKHGERISFLEVGFDTEKKEQALVLSQAQLQVSQEGEKAKRNQRNWLIALSALLVLLAVVLFRNYNGQKRLRAQEKVLHEREVNDLLKQQEINSLDAMMKGQEQERQRVGKDLHDRIGSMLSAVKLQFSALEGRMEQMESHQREQYQHVFNLLDETVTEVRRISHDMVRGTISQFGLVRALEDLRSAVHVPGKLEVTMSMFGMEERLEQSLEVAAYRMVQECVSNVMKHAQAKELTIQLTRTTAALNILIEDDGRGFDMVGTDTGMGMANIRERAATYKGSVNMDSRPGRGTSVSIDLPLTRLPEVG